MSQNITIEASAKKDIDTADAAWLQIDATGFDQIAEKLILERPEGEGWSRQKARFAVEWYKRFLKIKAKYREMRVVPNGLIDEVWHMHILDTRKYYSDMTRIFGGLLHHYPYFGLNGDGEERDAAFEETDRLYLKEFGQSCKSMDDATGAGCDAGDCVGSGSGCDAGDIYASGAGCDAGDFFGRDAKDNAPSAAA
jgi:hypothetical protein